MKLLSIIIPAYNESQTLAQLVAKVMAVQLSKEFTKEIILIDDCSKDDTLAIAKVLARKWPEIKVLSNERNVGKSQTVRRGILKSKGSLVIIQDADLEYDPFEILSLVGLLREKKLNVVYGNRFGQSNKVIYPVYYVGNRFISFVSNLFTFPRIRVWIPDLEVCYKLMAGDVARSVAKKIVSKSAFGLEPEITARLSKYVWKGKHLKFGIVPISYNARTIAEGKHIRAVRDGIKALMEIVRFNVFDH